ESLLHLQALAKIGEQTDGRNRLSSVVDEGRGKGYRDLLAPLSEHVAAVILQPTDSPEHFRLDKAHDFSCDPRGIQLGNVDFSDDFLCEISVTALGGAVEQKNAAAHVGRDDRVDRAVDDALQKFLGL